MMPKEFPGLLGLEELHLPRGLHLETSRAAVTFHTHPSTPCAPLSGACVLGDRKT